MRYFRSGILAALIVASASSVLTLNADTFAADVPTSQLQLVASYSVGDEPILDQPAALQFDEHATAWILNTGDCSIRRLTAKGEWLEPFGRCGEGPGELSGSRWLALADGKVYVFAGNSVNVFDRKGVFIERRAMELSGIEAGFLGSRAELIARDHARYDQVLVTSLPSLKQRVLFKGKGILYVFPFPSCYAAVAEGRKGRVLLLDEKGRVLRSIDLGIGEGTVTRHSDEQSQVSYESPVIAGAWSDGQGGCFMAVVADQTGPPGVLRHYGADFGDYELLRLPEVCEGGGQVIAHDGRIWILDEWGSALYACRLPRPRSAH